MKKFLPGVTCRISPNSLFHQIPGWKEFDIGSKKSPSIAKLLSFVRFNLIFNSLLVFFIQPF
jgi:hypothetical protein